jgi:hypothetical protein
MRDELAGGEVEELIEEVEVGRGLDTTVDLGSGNDASWVEAKDWIRLRPLLSAGDVVRG